MKQLSLKHKIALVELVVLIILGCYFFLPKSFSQAMGKGFDPDQVTAVTVQLEGARGKRGEEHTFTLSPKTPLQNFYPADLAPSGSDHKPVVVYHRRGFDAAAAYMQLVLHFSAFSV